MIKILLPILLSLLFIGCFSDEKTTTDSKKVENNITTSSKATQNTDKTKNPEEDSKKEPLFNLTTINGKTLNISELDGGLNIHEFKNKVVLFIFFGHQCPPCITEIPALVALTKEAHKDLEIIGLEVQGLDEDRLKNFAKHKNINYHLIAGDNNQNFVSYIANKAGWTGAIPFLLAMDKQGVVQIVHTGGLGKAQFDNIYNELKVEKKPQK